MSRKRHEQRVGVKQHTAAPVPPSESVVTSLPAKEELEECIRMYEHTFTSDCAARIRRVLSLLEVQS